MERGAVVYGIERSIKNIIRGFSIPVDLPSRLVDEVYNPMNFDGEFHWLLTFVVLKERIIHVYDSSMGTRIKEPRGGIKKLVTVLSSFLHAVVSSIKLGELTGHHWILTRTTKLECFWNQTSYLKLNSNKTSCNNNVIACINMSFIKVTMYIISLYNVYSSFFKGLRSVHGCICLVP